MTWERVARRTNRHGTEGSGRKMALHRCNRCQLHLCKIISNIKSIPKDCKVSNFRSIVQPTSFSRRVYDPEKNILLILILYKGLVVNKLSKKLSVNYNKSEGQIVSRNKCFVSNENRMRFGNHGPALQI